ncbi:MAG: hypothetical protein IJQ15_07370 [Synergistaceae bacterium]|nr:hypothetical protein [Synergistaceae bacterium]MBQ3760119.1 hypothetical protein [Synergistaceae bacterium]MBQ4402154.1 hypothetical protein [Synergistaceae bacterium]MBQ6418421.1 hypothetical protein [Synergistaceae bacterium]MBQ6982233.1 hypothetical protein [Synergistaceae bacterium]
MATQIAATPLLTGEDALRVLEDMKIMPTENALKAFKMLEEEFSKMVEEEGDDD